MLLHCVIFPVPYGYISTDFDVLCVQQLMLLFISSSSHADNGFSN